MSSTETLEKLVDDLERASEMDGYRVARSELNDGISASQARIDLRKRLFEEIRRRSQESFDQGVRLGSGNDR